MRLLGSVEQPLADAVAQPIQTSCLLPLGAQKTMVDGPIEVGSQKSCV